MVFDFSRRVGPVAHLVLQAHDMNPVALTIRPPARHQETGEAALGTGERQKSVAHGRRTEPLVPEQDIAAVSRPLCPRSIAAYVGTTLLFGHGHADGDTVFLRRRNEARIVSLRGQPRPPGLGNIRRRPQRRHARVGHEHGAGHTCFRLCHQDHHCAMQDVAGSAAATYHQRSRGMCDLPSTKSGTYS